MKTKFFALFILSFFVCSIIIGYGSDSNDDTKGIQSSNVESQTLQIISSPGLSDLAARWKAGFENLQPDRKIELTSQAGVTSLQEGFLYLTDNSNDLNSEQSAWKMIIAHEPVVAVVNSRNPLIKELNMRGFSSDDFAKVISGTASWSDFAKDGSKSSIQSYIVDNKQVIARLSVFTKIGPEELNISKVISIAELISVVQKNTQVIGFCMLTDVLSPDNKGYAEQISIVPVDKNKNGRIDSFENIYASPDQLTRGAWIGKYPRELCGEIYAEATSKPSNKTALDFMVFITSGGQELVKNSGYSILTSAEKTANLLALGNSVPLPEPGNKPAVSAFGRILILISLLLIITALIILILKRRKMPDIDSEDIEITPALNENTILVPKGLYYDKTHTWSYMEQDGMVKIGVDDFIKHITGTITQIRMKEPGEKVRKGEKILTLVRYGKQLNLYSPVSGYIRKQNGFLSINPPKISLLPYTDAWLYQIEPTNWKRESGFMFMFDKYRKWLEDEFIRLREFLASSANSNTLVYEHIVLQDGGELKDNVLADLGPEVWEDFQTKFIDVSK